MPERLRRRRRRRRDIRTASLRGRERALALAELRAEVEKQNEPGFFGRVGSATLATARALGVPGEYTRGVLAGRPGERVSARELLKETVGISPPEFQFSDPTTYPGGLLVLGTDILTDPLSYISGIGVLSKGGKAAKGAVKAAERASAGGLLARAAREAGAAERAALFAKRAAEEAARSEKLRGLAGGVEYGKTVAEQVARGQRRLLQFNLPFRSGGVPLPLPRAVETALLAGPGKAVSRLTPKAVKRFLQGSRTHLGKLGFFKDVAKVPGEYEAFRELLREGTRASRLKSLDTARELADEFEGLVSSRADELLSAGRISREEAADFARKEVESRVTAHRQLFTGAERTPELERLLEGVTDAEKAFGEKLSTKVLEKTRQQVAAGVRDPDAFVAGYVERMASDAALAVLKEKNLFPKFVRDMEAFYKANLAHEGSQIPRVAFLPQLNETANAWFRRNVPGFVGDWFVMDPVASATKAIAERDISSLIGNFLQATLIKFADNAGKLGDVPIAELASDERIPSLFKLFDMPVTPGSVKSFQKALEEAGMAADATIPLEVLEALRRDVMPVGLKSGPILSFIDNIIGLQRFSVTSPFLGFHFRNNTTNIINNMMAGVFDPFAYVRAARAWIEAVPTGPAADKLRKVLGLTHNPELAREWATAGVTGGGLFHTLRGESKIVDKLRNVGAKRLGGVKIFGAGEFVEDISRIAHFMEKRRAGATTAEAVASINKWLFDYSPEALTHFERNVLNRLFFFYRWTRYAVPMLFRAFLEHPSRTTQLLKATTQPQLERPPGLPEYIQETSAIPSGVDKEGRPTFIAGIGTPFEELNKFGVFDAKEPGAFGVGREAAAEISALLNPALKLGVLSFLTGKDNFLGTDIVQADRAPAIFEPLLDAGVPLPGLGVERVPTADGRTRVRMDPIARYVLANSPLGRLVSTASSFVSRGPVRGGLRFATGAREHSFRRAERGPLLEARRNLEHELERRRAAGEVGVGRFYYATGKAPEDVRKKARMIRQLIEAEKRRRRGVGGSDALSAALRGVGQPSPTVSGRP